MWQKHICLSVCLFCLSIYFSPLLSLYSPMLCWIRLSISSHPESISSPPNSLLTTSHTPLTVCLRRSHLLTVFPFQFFPSTAFSATKVWVPLPVAQQSLFSLCSFPSFFNCYPRSTLMNVHLAIFPHCNIQKMHFFMSLEIFMTLFCFCLNLYRFTYVWNVQINK